MILDLVSGSLAARITAEAATILALLLGCGLALQRCQLAAERAVRAICEHHAELLQQQAGAAQAQLAAYHSTVDEQNRQVELLRAETEEQRVRAEAAERRIGETRIEYREKIRRILVAPVPTDCEAAVRWGGAASTRSGAGMERRAMRSMALVLLLLAGGCCPKPAPEIRYVPQRVEVPVAAPVQEPPVFDRQPLPTESLPDDAPAQEVIRLLVATILQLQGEVKTRDEALDAYRRPTRPASSPDPSPIGFLGGAFAECHRDQQDLFCRSVWRRARHFSRSASRASPNGSPSAPSS